MTAYREHTDIFRTSYFNKNHSVFHRTRPEINAIMLVIYIYCYNNKLLLYVITNFYILPKRVTLNIFELLEHQVSPASMFINIKKFNNAVIQCTVLLKQYHVVY